MKFIQNLIFLSLFIFSSKLFAKLDSSYELPPSSTHVPLNYNTEILKKISSGVSSIAEASKKSLVYVEVKKRRNKYKLSK